MAKQKQIICFIDPEKFGALIGNNLPNGYEIDDVYLDNGNNLVYVQNEGTCEVLVYVEVKSKAASIILVPDSFNFQYAPEALFKVLWHNGTNEASRVQRLRDTNNFQGDNKSMEEPDTPYQKIADLINKKVGVTFDNIYKDIKNYDTKEENLTDDIFNAIYEQKDEDAIEKAVSKRDKYIIEKGNN